MACPAGGGEGGVADAAGAVALKAVGEGKGVDAALCVEGVHGTPYTAFIIAHRTHEYMVVGVACQVVEGGRAGGDHQAVHGVGVGARAVGHHIAAGIGAPCRRGRVGGDIAEDDAVGREAGGSHADGEVVRVGDEVGGRGEVAQGDVYASACVRCQVDGVFRPGVACHHDGAHRGEGVGVVDVGHHAHLERTLSGGRVDTSPEGYPQGVEGAVGNFDAGEYDKMRSAISLSVIECPGQAFAACVPDGAHEGGIVCRAVVEPFPAFNGEVGRSQGARVGILESLAVGQGRDGGALCVEGVHLAPAAVLSVAAVRPSEDVVFCAGRQPAQGDAVAVAAHGVHDRGVVACAIGDGITLRRALPTEGGRGGCGAEGYDVDGLDAGGSHVDGELVKTSTPVGIRGPAAQCEVLSMAIVVVEVCRA